MPTFAEYMRQQAQAQPAEEPSSFSQFMRRQQEPAAPQPEQGTFASFWRTFRETPAVSTTLALGRGALGAASGLAGFSRMGNEWAADLGIPVVSQKAREAADHLEPVAAQLDSWQRSLTGEKDTGSFTERLFHKDPVGAIPKALFETIPYMAAGAAGLPGAAGIAAARTGQEYRRMVEAGALPEKARLAASLVGTTEAILERLVPARIVKGLDKDLLGRVISQSGLEAGTEFLQHYPAVIADLATGLRDGSLTRQDFYDALEDALMGGAIGSVAGAATPRTSPRLLGPDAEIRERLRDRVAIGDDAVAAGVTDSTESGWQRVYRHLVDKQAPIQIDSEMEHAVERSRGAPMIARVPFELGIFQTDARGELVQGENGRPIQVARPLEQILQGQNLDHLRTLLVAEQDIELMAQDKPGTQAERSLEDLTLLQRRLGNQGYAQLQGVATEFRDWLTKATIDPLISIGALTPEAKAAMLAKNQFYSPMLKMLEDVDPSFSAGSKQFQGVGKPIKGRKTSFGQEGNQRVLDPIEASIRRVVQVTKFVERQRVANLAVDKFLADPDLQPLIEDLGGGLMQPRDSIFKYEDGKKHYYRMPEPIMQAVNDYTGKQMNFFADKILAPMSRLARAGFTYALDFASAATFKDQWEAFVYSPGLNPVTSFVPGIGLAEGIGRMVGKGDLFTEYMQSGAGHGGLVAADRKDVQQLMELKMTGGKGAQMRQYLNPVNILRDLGNTLSEASRLGIFAARKRAGDTTQEARHAARHALTDFRRMGSTGEQMNAVVAFWNAQVQGLDKFARTFNPVNLAKGDKAAWTAYTKAMTSVTLPSILLWMKNQDDEDYQRLPTWEKNAYWHVGKFKVDELSAANPLRLFLGKANQNEYWLRLPKPFELGWIFGSLPERLLDYAKSQNPGQLVESLTEFGSELLPGILPTAAMPFLENATNHSFFFGGPIVPHGTENRPPEEQYTERTPQAIRDFSAAAGRVPVLPAAIQATTGTSIASPAQVENLAYGLTGTMGRDALTAADSVYGKTPQQGLPMDPRRLPLMRRFTSPADPNLGAQPIREMFKEINRVDGLATTVSSKVKAGKKEEAREFAARFPEWKGAKWLRRRRQTYIDQRKVWERIRNSNLEPQEKQRRLKIQEAKMVKTAEVTLGGWREYMQDLKEKR